MTWPTRRSASRSASLSGVSQVRVYGTKSAVRIKADPSALAARGMSVDDLAGAIQQGTSYQGAGQIDGPNRTYLLQPQGQLADASQYNKLIIGTKNGAPIYLRDVATARDSVEDERINMRFWIRDTHVPKATVVIAVIRQPGSNAVEVADTVKSLVPEIAPTLPASVVIIPIHDRSETIVHSVNDVQETLFIAFVLVVLVIFFFLGRATDTIIPVVALPMSLLLDVHRHELAGLQPGQPVADGLDAGRWGSWWMMRSYSWRTPSAGWSDSTRNR